jgi:hypothetical protein
MQRMYMGMEIPLCTRVLAWSARLGAVDRVLGVIWAALVAELHAQIQIECDRLNTLSLLIFCLNDKFVSEHFSVAARRVSEYVELTSLLSPTFSALY